MLKIICFLILMTLIFIYIWTIPETPEIKEITRYRDFFIDNNGDIVFDKPTSIDIIT